MKKTILMMIIAVGLMASQALNPSVIKTYKQPDGTIFKGYLKGTAALSWIESNNNLVKYNVNDRYYYKIDIVDSKIVYIEKYLGSTISKSVNRSSSLMQSSDFVKKRNNSMQMIFEEKTNQMHLRK
jgi:hypothetical protein